LTNGKIFYGDLVTTTPFENLLHSVELQGKVIREALEFSVADENSVILLQLSGLRVIYDLKKEPYNRIVLLNVLCRICERDIPKYEQIDDEKVYRVSMPSFLAGGGDGFTMIEENSRNTIYGPRDIDALTNFIEKNSPLNKPLLAGRISFV
jgi:2',3'-cyclic-nucleotide 2'-phosphodiesterase (5'-nucleotidase family)